ncbi:NAD(P)-binding domain-containing protein [Sphingobacterium sp. UME9]|uniref:NAD(P)-binding domain-containing protein n=1 Tax=Sphingobacterium sp. UME9 TaxID=1862316 RepID=UPI0016021847|nr:NAD(P)-binding domain-containing protein [Sphingobacterium sp. UME9]MBB1645108.1 pyridine nucleotide-disulfide oxidoreductase [Sphingobacterium sp. UME9]
MITNIRYKTKIAVIGAGQAGLSAAYHLKKLGLKIGPDFIILDEASAPGGAWQFRWDSLTLSTVNKIHDLPGMSFEETLSTKGAEVQANTAVPHYFKLYEEKFELQVYRPAKVEKVYMYQDRFHIDTAETLFSALGIINATGTWENPYIPTYPGAELFRGEQLHTKDFKTAEYFRGKHVIVVGAGISAIQLLDQISKVTTTTWVTRRPPLFREGPFDDMAGHNAVAMVEERVRLGLSPLSVVSVTGLPYSTEIQEMEKRGVLQRFPMFQEITEKGIKWDDGTEQKADVILWNTGFKSSLSHLDPVLPKEKQGGIQMAGRLATMVAKEPRIHLVGYGPSASTIGANRAGSAAARELLKTLSAAELNTNTFSGNQL